MTAEGSACRRWASFHLFVDGLAVDSLLEAVVAPLVDSLGRRGRRQWFFVRYGEGGPHVRLRVAVDGDDGPVRCALESLVARSFPTRLRVVPQAYEPEVERYGGPQAIDVAEEHFTRSSEAVLEALQGGCSVAARRLEIAVLLLSGYCLEASWDGDTSTALLAEMTHQLLPARARHQAVRAGHAHFVAALAKTISEETAATVNGDSPFSRWRRDCRTLSERFAAVAGTAAPWRRMLSSQMHMTLNRLGVHGRAEGLAYAVVADAFGVARWNASAGAGAAATLATGPQT